MKKTNLVIKSMIAIAVVAIFTACTKELDTPQNNPKPAQQLEVSKIKPSPGIIIILDTTAKSH
jgi:hypothetical protein